MVGAAEEDFPGTKGRGGKPGLSGRICAMTPGSLSSEDTDIAVAPTGKRTPAVINTTGQKIWRLLFIGLSPLSSILIQVNLLQDGRGLKYDFFSLFVIIFVQIGNSVAFAGIQVMLQFVFCGI